MFGLITSTIVMIGDESDGHHALFLGSLKKHASEKHFYQSYQSQTLICVKMGRHVERDPGQESCPA